MNPYCSKKDKRDTRLFTKSGARMFETKSSGSGYHSDKRKRLREKMLKYEKDMYIRDLE